MNVNVTFNPQKFEKLNLPQVNHSYIRKFSIPNLTIGKTYYKLTDEKSLQAFRILAITLEMNGNCEYVCYLIQTPNSTNWERNYFTNVDVIFEEKDDLFSYLQGNTYLNVNTKWNSITDYFRELNDFRDEVFGEFYHSWYINSRTKCANVASTNVKYVLLLEDSIEVCLEHKKDYYFNTKEECLAHYLNGLVIDDFAEEEEITIKVLPNKSSKKVLQVIEIDTY